MDTTSNQLGDDARRTKGVEYVEDRLQVRLLDRRQREGPGIRGAALQRLARDSEIPRDATRVSVKDGRVTLKGDAVLQFRSDEAFDRVASLHGVAGVTNETRVDEPR
jgi:osmotically-inducible protein OsmY